MNIGFDAAAIFGPMSRNRGIGNYTLSQFCHMIDMDDENHYFLLNLYAEESLAPWLRHPERLHEEYHFSGRSGLLLGEETLLRGILRAFLRRNRIDVFYTTSPFENHQRPYRCEWFGDVRVVATVYDIIPYVLRGAYLRSEEALRHYLDHVDALRGLDKLLVISQSVKDDLTAYLGFPSEQIEVIWGAAGTHFRKLTVPEAVGAQLRAHFGIDSPFVMCTGGDDERKNLARLIEAFARLPETLRAKHQLVIVCRLQPASETRCRALAEKLGVSGRVVLTNFVSDEELIYLYNLCELVAFPSTYEGFGLPVTEAWACGKPVLTSNNSSLVQIAGDAALLVDPFSTESVAEGLRAALEDCDLAQLARRGEERLALFCWPRVAETALRAITALRAAPASDPAPAPAAPRRALAFFTPLPPMESGISDYSTDILGALSAYFDIDVYIDDGYEPNCPLPNTVRIYPHSLYPTQRSRYYDTVYQMGNSSFHIYMWPYLRSCGGTLVLHDYNLHGSVVYAMIGQRADWEGYAAILAEDGVAVPANTTLPNHEVQINAFLTDHADRVIVHSREAREALLRRNIGRSVKHICHYARMLPLPDAVAAKRELGIAPEELLFASFGFVHETKRALPLLRAFLRFAPEEPRAHYVFVGKLDSGIENEFNALVAESELGARVSVTGFTPLDTFKRYIDAADVCFNLRWPYNGETSGSFMRLLAAGKCTVVSDLGSFAEVPDEACIKLPRAEGMRLDKEVDIILAVMRELSADRGLRENYGRAARRYAEDNLELGHIAEQYAQFLQQPRERVLTEELLCRLRGQAAAQGYTRAECAALAETLASIEN